MHIKENEIFTMTYVSPETRSTVLADKGSFNILTHRKWLDTNPQLNRWSKLYKSCASLSPMLQVSMTFNMMLCKSAERTHNH